MDLVQVWKELTSKVEEKITSLKANSQQSCQELFEEYYESAKLKLEGPGGAPTFVPKVRTEHITHQFFGSTIYLSYLLSFSF